MASILAPMGWGAVGVIAFLSLAKFFKKLIADSAKAAVEHKFAVELERHRSELQSDRDKGLEALKSELQRASAESGIRLTRVFERTVDAIAGTHEKLLSFNDAVGHYTSIVEWAHDPPKLERRKIAAERLAEFRAYYRPKKLFIPKKTVAKIDKFFEDLNRTAIEFMHGIEENGDAKSARIGSNEDSWVKAHDFMTKEAPIVLEALEDDLRAILGID